MNFNQQTPASPTDVAAPNQSEDLGFGTRSYNLKSRLINPDGSFNVTRRGAGLRGWNGYIWLVTTTWWKFFVVVLLYYMIGNTFFAALYLIAGIDNIGGIANHQFSHQFFYAFFFSVQTFTTVGYGALHPTGMIGNIIASFNALVGLMSFALATGLFYARFSRPTASILFSKKAVIAPYKDNLQAFMFRIANARSNQIMDVEARVVITWLAPTFDGNFSRRYAQMALEREKVAMFPLNWTIVHPILSDSPLYDKDQIALAAMDAEFIIIIKGFDDTFSQTIHTHYSYKATDLIFNAKFIPMYETNKEGRTILNLDTINNIKIL